MTSSQRKRIHQLFTGELTAFSFGRTSKDGNDSWTVCSVMAKDYAAAKKLFLKVVNRKRMPARIDCIVSECKGYQGISNMTVGFDFMKGPTRLVLPLN